MKRFIIFFLAAALCGNPVLPDKKNFDLNYTAAAPLAKSLDRAIPNRSFIQDNAMEASMLEGAFFTLGTNTGATNSALDDKCCLTFGHPYALTSYPFIKVNGRWGRLADFTDITRPFVRRTADSVTFFYTLTDSLLFSLSIYLSGNSAAVETKITNQSLASKTVQCGLMYDPAVGWFNPDAAAWLDNVFIGRECGAAGFGSLKFTEKGVGRTGLVSSIIPEAGNLESAVFANWNDLESGYSAPWDSARRALIYDLTARFIWQPVSLAPESTFTSRIRIDLDTPDFGTSAFIRWDAPRFSSVENGILFPKTVDSKAYVFNSAAAAATLSLLADFPYQAVCPAEAMTLTLPASAGAYQTVSFRLRENYAADTIVPLTLIAGISGSEMDRVETNLLAPVSPSSDTGLSVRIDSFFSDAGGQKFLIFNTQINQPPQFIFDLGQEHLGFYENGAQIRNYFLGRDTTGGVSNVDIVFVLDVTGSMGNEIDEVKKNISAFGDTLKTRGVNYRLGMVTFLDVIENTYPLTSDLALFKSEVNAQSAHGGGDTPENSLEALKAAASLSFRPDAKRIFIWITDANYHVNNANTPLVPADVVNALLAKDILVYSVGPENYRTDSYFPIYNPTGGKWFDIGGPFLDVLMDIANLKYSKNMMLAYTAGTSFTAVDSLRLDVHYAGLGGSAGKAVRPSQAPLPKIALSGLSCSPNPCNPSTTITFDLAQGVRAELSVTDIRGRRVFQQSVRERPGRQAIAWSGRNSAGDILASGIYVVKLQSFVKGGARPALLQQKLVLSK